MRQESLRAWLERLGLDVGKHFLILWITKAPLTWQHLAWKQGLSEMIPLRLGD